MKTFLKYEKYLILISVVLIFLIGGISVVVFISKEKNNSTKMISKISIAPSEKKGLLVKGSIPYWDQKMAVSSFKNNKKSFDYVNVFWYYLNADGSIQKYEYANEDEELIRFAHENNVKVSAVITNLGENPDGWDSRRVENIINSSVNRKNHINQIVSKVNEKNFDGIIIDYELLKQSTRDNYTIFIKELFLEMKKQNKILTIVLHPKTGENEKGESTSGYQDWQELAKYADQIQIMGYSQHTDEDEPGPIAGIGWVGKIVDYTLILGVDPGKVFLGIPLFGYDWNKNSNESAKGLTFEEVQSLLIKEKATLEFDEIHKSPMFRYDSHEVWFENADSVYAKAELAKKAKFAGVTFWRLGGEDQDVWKELEKLKSN